jgi:hypothetical protein
MAIGPFEITAGEVWAALGALLLGLLANLISPAVRSALAAAWRQRLPFWRAIARFNAALAYAANERPTALIARMIARRGLILILTSMGFSSLILAVQLKMAKVPLPEDVRKHFPAAFAGLFVLDLFVLLDLAVTALLLSAPEEHLRFWLRHGGGELGTDNENNTGTKPFP